MFSPAFAPLNGPEAIVNNKLCSIFLKYGLSVDVVSRDSSQFVNNIVYRLEQKRVERIGTIYS